MGEIPLGVYGLRISGLPLAAAQAFVPVPSEATEVVVEVLVASSVATLDRCDGDSLVLAYARGARYEIRRHPATATISLPAQPSPEALVHPLLTIVASTHGRWRGALTLHGGAFVLDGRAWAVLAEKDGGKSTTLAGLAGRGLPVLTDDLVVVDGGDVLAGPRSIDLRPDAAEHLGEGEYIGFAGGRHRHRIALGQPPSRVPLAGLAVLTWSDGRELRVRKLSIDERLGTICRHEALSMMGSQPPEALFQAVGLPMYEVSRPRSWAAHDRVVDALVELAGRASPTPARPAGAGSTTATSAAAGSRPP